MSLVNVSPFALGVIGGIPCGNSGTLIMDAATEKIDMCGRVRYYGTDPHKHISKVWIRFGAVTKTAGTGLTLSLQDVSTTTGPPMQPDAGADQTVAIAPAGITANTWYQTGALSGTRQVVQGELLAVVLDFDGTGWLSADSFALQSSSDYAGDAMSSLNCLASHAPSGTWSTTVFRWPVVVLEFDDGHFGTLGDSMPSPGTTAYNSGTNPEERGLRFQTPFPCKCVGATVALALAANAECAVSLYSVTGGSTPLATVAIDLNTISAAASTRLLTVLWPEVELTANTTYYIAVRATTANNVTLNEWTVGAAGHWEAYPMGTTWYEATTTDAGVNWVDVTTMRPCIFPLLSAVDDGAGGKTSYVLGIA